MRIIDQNGCDYPYESIVISHGDGMIYARPVSNMEKQYFLARYSTEEKAEKAMQKLHECYTGVFVLNNAPNTEESIDKLQKLNSLFFAWKPYQKDFSIENINNLVFRLPEEDEL